jgi:hypothetical protein
MANRITTHILKNSNIVNRPLPSSLLAGEPIVNTADGIVYFSGVTSSTNNWVPAGTGTTANFFEAGSNLYDLQLRNRITKYEGVTGAGLNGKFLSGTTNGFVLANISSIGGVDTYVTGFTYSNNVATIKQNNGQADLSILIDTMTGLTVNGTLSATTGNISTANVNALNATGITVTNNVTATTFIGNLNGLASLATSATTALNATSATTALNATNAVSATTALNATNAVSATTALNATNATNVVITNNTTTNATYYPTFVSATSGNQALNVDSSTLTFNPSTNTLTVPNLSGLASLATSATTALNATNAINANIANNAPVSGVYSSGTLTLTNLTGGTFNVTGLTSTDTFVTGFTYSPTTNTITLSQNQGQPNQTIQINTVSGLTVSDLTANRLVYTTTSGKLITGTATFDGTNMVLPTAGSLSVGTGGLIVGSGGSAGVAGTGDVVINGSLTVFGPSVSAFTSQLYVEDNNITLNYNPTGNTTATSIGAGWTLQDGNGINGGNVNLDIRAMNTFTGLTSTQVPSITEYTGPTGFANRAWVTQLNDVVIRSTSVTTPNGVRVLAEFDVLDGGTY